MENISKLKKTLKSPKRKNPKATFKFIRKGVAYYRTEIREGQTFQIFFESPVIDMGDADFESTMDAKLLIRWIV
jgi:hypothetical protein